MKLLAILSQNQGTEFEFTVVQLNHMATSDKGAVIPVCRQAGFVGHFFCTFLEKQKSTNICRRHQNITNVKALNPKVKLNRVKTSTYPP